MILVLGFHVIKAAVACKFWAYILRHADGFYISSTTSFLEGSHEELSSFRVLMCLRWESSLFSSFQEKVMAVEVSRTALSMCCTQFKQARLWRHSYGRATVISGLKEMLDLMVVTRT
jgi:hypothetical protein